MSEIDMTSTGQSHTVRLLNISNIKYQIHVHPLPDATRFFIEKNYVLSYRYIEKLSAHYGLETLLPTQKIDASSNTSKQIISTIAYYPKTSDTALSESLENFNVIQTVSKYDRSALTFIAHYTGFMKKGRRKTT